MLTSNLWDLNKQGTIILANSRYGSHFVAKVIEHLLKNQHTVTRHGELSLADESFVGIEAEMNGLENRPGYKIAIINDQLPKALVIAKPQLLDNWHVVRIMHNNKLRWFLSYWFFLMSRGPGADHHNTKQQVYLDQINTQQPVELSVWQIKMLCSTLNQTIINQQISCDFQLEFDDLADYAVGSDVAWLGNEYPNMQLSELFTNSEVIEKLLTNWPKEIPSAIRE
jgi:hypothetical protein